MTAPKTTRTTKIKTIKGHKYAYDTTSYWDKNTKKYRKKTTYLGKLTNQQTKQYQPKKTTPPTPPNTILTFGDTHAITQTIKNTKTHQAIQTLTPNNQNTLTNLICYKLLKTSSMQHTQTWTNANYITKTHPTQDLTSQKISNYLKQLGNQTQWHQFFQTYLQTITTTKENNNNNDNSSNKTGVIIDTTSLPNDIDFPLSAWGRHGSESQRQTRLLLVVDRTTKRPLYFNYKAGNIVDVTTLSNTIAELSAMGVKTSFALIDAGYYSKNNIKELYAKNISFLTRLPAGRVLYKTLIAKHSASLEDAANYVVYGKRALYVKCVEVDLFGHSGFAYVCCDVRRKGDELTKVLLAAKEDKLSLEEIDAQCLGAGKFVLLSSERFLCEEVLPLYYMRQGAENLFGVSKCFLDLLPLRTHCVETFRGYLMLNFVCLLVYFELKSLLGEEFSVEEALLELSNLFCCVYESVVVVCEPTRRMKRVCELLGVVLPKTLKL